MNDKHRGALRRQWTRLRRDLEPKKLLPYLVTVLDETDEQEVKAKETREERCDKLLEILPRRGPQAFGCFLEALESVQPFLADSLKEEAEREQQLAEMKTELSRARSHSAKMREEITSSHIHLESERNKHEKTRKELEELKSLHQSLLKQFKTENSTMTFAIKELKSARKHDAGELRAEKAKRSELAKELSVVKSDHDRITNALKEREDEIKNLNNKWDNYNFEELQMDDSVFQSKEENKGVRQQMEGRKWSLEETQRNSRQERSDRIEALRRRALSETREIENERLNVRQIKVSSMESNITEEHEKLHSLVASVTHERDLLKTKCEELEDSVNDLDTKLLQAQRERQDRATSPIKNGTQNGDHAELTACDNCTHLEDQCEEINKQKDQMHLTNRTLEEQIRQLECRTKERADKFDREKSWLEKKVKSMEEHNEQTLRDHAHEIRNTKMELTEHHLLVVKDLQNQKDELNSKVDKDKLDVLRIKIELDKERESHKGQQRDFEKMKKKLQSEKKQLKQKLELETKTKKDAEKEAERCSQELDEKEKRSGDEVSRLRQNLSVQQDRYDTLKIELDQWKGLTGKVFNYKKDFDRNGVIYALGIKFGKSSGENPSVNGSGMGVVVTRSSSDQGVASDLLENRKGTLSSTRDEERSWWCIDLGDSFTLFPTQYTLRHGRDNGLSIIRNWKLEGSRDGKRWKALKVHENDRGLKGSYPFYTGTWTIDGQVGAMRYFRIYQTGKNSSGRYGLYLSGFEIYGVLVDMRV